MGTARQTLETPSPAVVFDTLMAHQRTAALRAGVELGVFRAIGEGITDVPALAKRCGASERGIRILCDYLTVIGLLRKEDGRYLHTRESAMFLDPASPACVASITGFLGRPEMVDATLHLADIVRSGTTILPGAGSVEPEHPMWVDFAHSMAPMMAPMTRPLGEIVLAGLSGPVKVLDVAAGHGLFGIEVARQNTQARIVAVDWPAVLEVARGNAAKAGVQDRYELLPGSAFDVDYAGPYDIVLLTNFLHHFDVPTCVQLLRKVRAATRDGGRVAALEFVPDEDRVSPPMAAAFSLTMLVSTPAGDAYTFSELEAMFRDAGFAEISAHPVPTGPHTVVMGVAP